MYSIRNKCKERSSPLITSEKRYIKSRVQIKLDEFNVDVIRRTVHEHYTIKDYIPNIGEPPCPTEVQRSILWWPHHTVAGVARNWFSLQEARKQTLYIMSSQG